MITTATTPTRAEIAAIIRARVSERIAPRSGWTDDTALVDLGFDSLELVDLGMAIEDDFKARDWTLDLVVNREAFATVNAIADFVLSRVER